MPVLEVKAISPEPSEAPLYTPEDAARYLHLPVWAVTAMDGREPLDPDWIRQILAKRRPSDAATERIEYQYESSDKRS